MCLRLDTRRGKRRGGRGKGNRTNDNNNENIYKAQNIVRRVYSKRIHARTYTQACTYTHKCMHTCITHIHTYTRTHAHTHTHTHTNDYESMPSLAVQTFQSVQRAYVVDMHCLNIWYISHFLCQTWLIMMAVFLIQKSCRGCLLNMVDIHTGAGQSRSEKGPRQF